MDAVVVEKSLYADVLAFVRTMADSCDGCFRKGVQCRECDVRVAPGLLRRLEACYAPRHVSDDPRVRRCVEILEVIRNSETPVRSRDILLSEYCSKFAKFKSIRFLIRHGLVEACKDFRGVMKFHVPESMVMAADAIIERGEIDL